jgi:Lon protease-like protein
MGLNLYTTNAGDLPKILPIMPLPGGILLPRSELQVPFSDVSNLSSVLGSSASNGTIGVVQSENRNGETLFRCGCAGKTFDVQEVEDIGFVLSITGICRFEIESELEFDGKCRRALVSYKKYEADIVQEADFLLDRERLISVLRTYCKKLNIFPNWKEIEGISNERLVTMLMMICPFDSKEKQTLLETVGYTEQSRLITSMMEMDVASVADVASFLYH